MKHSPYPNLTHLKHRAHNTTHASPFHEPRALQLSRAGGTLRAKAARAYFATPNATTPMPRSASHVQRQEAQKGSSWLQDHIEALKKKKAALEHAQHKGDTKGTDSLFETLHKAASEGTKTTHPSRTTHSGKRSEPHISVENLAGLVGRTKKTTSPTPEKPRDTPQHDDTTHKPTESLLPGYAVRNRTSPGPAAESAGPDDTTKSTGQHSSALRDTLTSMKDRARHKEPSPPEETSSTKRNTATSSELFKSLREAASKGKGASHSSNTHPVGEQAKPKVSAENLGGLIGRDTRRADKVSKAMGISKEAARGHTPLEPVESFIPGHNVRKHNTPTSPPSTDSPSKGDASSTGREASTLDALMDKLRNGGHSATHPDVASDERTMHDVLEALRHPSP
ncbi:MAG: hypothetical protein AAFS10_02410, partial [Myxococcota bacterium]